MGLELLVLGDDLGVEAMSSAIFDLYYDGLIHLVANHDAFAGLAEIAVGHAAPPIPSSRSRIIV